MAPMAARYGERVARQAAAGNLSIRELMIEVTRRQSFIGSPATVAATINEFVQADASDGFDPRNGPAVSIVVLVGNPKPRSRTYQAI